jgi:LysR family glycine cleavage system transcriptional activator
MHKRHLPPLTAIRTFEALARLRHITIVAEELGVTTGAVTKQIKLLENYLGTSICYRTNQGLTLNTQGEQYAQTLHTALDAIETASEVLRQSHTQDRTHHLSINLLPSLASGYFFESLQDFRHQHPRCMMSIDTGDGEIDWQKNAPDIAIRVSTRADWPQCHAVKLMPEILVLIGSKTLLAKHHIKEFSPEYISTLPLIQNSCRPYFWNDYWSHWSQDTSHLHYSVTVEHFFMQIKAVKESLGIALLPHFLIQEALQAGDFLQLLPTSFISPYHYWALTLPHRMNKPLVRACMSWIKRQANHIPPYSDQEYLHSK